MQIDIMWILCERKLSYTFLVYYVGHVCGVSDMYVYVYVVVSILIYIN